MRRALGDPALTEPQPRFRFDRFNPRAPRVPSVVPDGATHVLTCHVMTTRGITDKEG